MKKILIGLGVFIAIILGIIILSPSGNESFQEGMKDGSQVEQQKEYEVIEDEDAGVVQNISVLVDPGTTEESLTAYMVDLQSGCEKDCNISFYDDQKAYELDKEYKGITDMDAADAWKKENYVFVGDHLLAMMTFDDPGNLWMYPMRDWYYDELKSAD